MLKITNYGNQLTLADERKITISTSTKANGNKYISYQVNMPLAYLNLLENKNTLMEHDYKTKKELYIIKIDEKQYEIKTSAKLTDKAIKISFNPNYKRRTIPITLSKKDIEYINAYDTYRNMLLKINQEINKTNPTYKTLNKQNKIMTNEVLPFALSPLTAIIKLSFVINNSKQELEPFLYLNLDVKIYDDFAIYVKKINDNSFPLWLDTLLSKEHKDYLINNEQKILESMDQAIFEII